MPSKIRYVEVTREGFHSLRVGSVWKVLGEVGGQAAHGSTLTIRHFQVTDPENRCTMHVPHHCVRYVTKSAFTECWSS